MMLVDMLHQVKLCPLFSLGLQCIAVSPNICKCQQVVWLHTRLGRMLSRITGSYGS